MRSILPAVLAVSTLLSSACSFKLDPVSSGPIMANTGPTGGQSIHVSSMGYTAGTPVTFPTLPPGAGMLINGHPAPLTLVNGTMVPTATIDSRGTADLILTSDRPGTITVRGEISGGQRGALGRTANTSAITFVDGPFHCPTTPATLPDISQFRESAPNSLASDRFVVDPGLMAVGYPFYMGILDPASTGRRDAGAHAQFNSDDFDGVTDVNDFPAVYAPMAGVIRKADDSFFDPNSPPPLTCTPQVTPCPHNLMYSVSIEFAKQGNKKVLFSYTLEPMVASPPSPATTYAAFLHVKEGDCVKKNDIIAHLYVPPHNGIAPHVHFNTSIENNVPLAPAIFKASVVSEFQQHWNSFGFFPDGSPIPTTMGFGLDPTENPYGTGAKDCLDPQDGPCP